MIIKIRQLLLLFLVCSSIAYAQLSESEVAFVTNGKIYTQLTQADGKKIVGGDFTIVNEAPVSGLVRFNKNGSIDNTFNTGAGFNVGKEGQTRRPIRNLAIQKDGKIVVAGDFTSFNGVKVNRLVRLNKDGGFDEGFSSKIRFNDGVYSVNVQPDGKIIATGKFSTCDGEYASYKIARINSDGSLDLNFNIHIGTGFYTSIGAGRGKGFAKDTEIPKSITLQSDGKILIEGNFTFFDGKPVKNKIKLNADGSYGTPSNNAKPDFTLYNLKIQANRIGNSFVLQTSSGKLIVMDGGYPEEADYLRKFILRLGGTVEAWFMSHPHGDHAGAFNTILKDPQGVVVKNIYHSKPPQSWLKAPSYKDLYRTIDSVATRGVNVVNFNSVPQEVITIDKTHFRILSVANPEITEARINNSSMAMRVWDAKKSIVFLADLQVEGGDKLLKSPQRQYLDCDYLQMAHHGNNGVSEEFYRTVKFKACIWPTSSGVWDNYRSGFNTHVYDTLKQRELVDNQLGIRRNYISCKGVNVIK